MKDEKYKNLLSKLNEAHIKYHQLLKQAEEEYKKRFGEYPTNLDDDFWIDSFHVKPTGASLEDVPFHAKFIVKNNR